MTEDELKTLTAPFLGKKLDAHFRYSQRTAWSFPELPARERYSFGFHGGGLGAPELFSATAHQIPSSGGLVNAPGLPFQAGTDEHWMQDVRIQYLAEYPYYANEDLQYQLPRRGSISSLFSALPGRVDADGGLSLLTGKRQPLFLKIPDDRDILLNAIGCGRRGTYDGNLSRRELPPIYLKQRSSDKARYCRGVLDLFGGIFAASHTFDTRFWKNTFSYLAGLGGRTTNTNSSVVYRTIEKYPEHWMLDDTLPREQEIARLEKEIVKLSQCVRVRENEVTLQFLEKSLTAERAEFRQQQSEGELTAVIDTPTEAAEIRADLLRALQGFVEAKILRQGTNTHCRHCGSKIWQEFSSLQQEFKCVGCGALNHSDVEATWYYRLNTLLRGGIIEYGTIPVIAALAAARSEAKQSFIYSPGFEFYERYEDRKAAAELDVICLVDGELWVGEVKTNISKFKPKEMDKLVREAKKMHADKAFVFASEGDQNLLHKQCEEASKLNNFPIIQLRPSSWGQTASFHI